MKLLLKIFSALLFVTAAFVFNSCQKSNAPVFEYKTNEYIKDWLIAGPFPNCEGCSESNFKHGENCTGFYTDYMKGMGGEANAIPDEGETVAFEDTVVKWFRYHSGDGIVHLSKLMKPKDMVVGYAFCRVHSPEEQKTILSVGSNDGVKVYLNGEKVHEIHLKQGRWLQPDDDYVPVTLKKGMNNLMLKIDQGTGDFGYVVRFLDYDSIVSEIKSNIEKYKNLKVLSYGDTLIAVFGEDYKISVLNPSGKVKLELLDEKNKKLAEKNVKPGFEARFMTDNVPDGYLSVKATFLTADGKPLISETRIYKGKLPRHPRVKRLRKDLTMVDARGKQFFPIGTYGAPVEDYKKLKEAGYNFVVASADDLDAIHDAGLYAAVHVHGRTPEEYYDFISKYKDHPAVLCWMLYDEPGYNKADILFINNIYQAAYRADKVHPSYLVITNNRFYSSFGRLCDVLAVDTYPVTNGTIEDVGHNIRKAYKDLDGEVPVWHCGQMFNWPEQRRPTPQEHRFMSYHALMYGVKGMLWYTYKGYGQYLPEDDPELWEAQKKFLKELNDLAPVFLAPGLGQSVETSSENIEAVVKSSKKGTYLIVANISKTENAEAVVKVGNSYAGRVPVYGENRKANIEKGELKDGFKPLDVHIYKLK